jgi:hypothetical protein
MATTSGNPATGTTIEMRAGTVGTGVRAKVAAGLVALGCATALALGGLGAGAAAGALPGTPALPAMLAVADRGCVHASAEGIPGEGCGPARYTLIQVAPAGDESGCVYASYEGVPGAGCSPARDDSRESQP